MVTTFSSSVIVNHSTVTISYPSLPFHTPTSWVSDDYTITLPLGLLVCFLFCFYSLILFYYYSIIIICDCEPHHCHRLIPFIPSLHPRLGLAMFKLLPFLLVALFVFCFTILFYLFYFFICGCLVYQLIILILWTYEESNEVLMTRTCDQSVAVRNCVFSNLFSLFCFVDILHASLFSWLNN
jgi:hypothetical protein